MAVAGAVTPSTGVTGTTSTYSCNSGFYLTGATQTTCQTSSTWSAAAPTCTAASITMVSAVYGIGGSLVNTLAAFQSACNGRTTCTVAVTNSLAGQLFAILP